MEIAGALARLGNRILSMIAAIMILLMLLYGGYSLWDTVMVYRGAFLSSDLLQFKPAEDAVESPTLLELQACLLYTSASVEEAAAVEEETAPAETVPEERQTEEQKPETTEAPAEQPTEAPAETPVMEDDQKQPAEAPPCLLYTSRIIIPEEVC